jgi:hypothetical protein
LSVRNRYFAILCASAWLGAAVTMWVWRAPLPRGTALHGVSSAGIPFFLSRDGRYLATGKGAILDPRYARDPQWNDGKLALSLWEIATGNESFHLLEPRGRFVVFSADAQRLAILVNDREMKVWNTGTMEVFVLKGDDFYPHPGRWTAFSPDGQLLAVGVGRGRRPSELWIWDLNRKERVGVVALPALEPGLTFSPDGSRLAVVSHINPLKVRFVDWATQTISAEMDTGVAGWHHTPDDGELQFAPNGQTLAAFERDGGQICFLDPATGLTQQVWETVGMVGTVEFSPDSSVLAVRCVDMNPRARRQVLQFNRELANYLFPRENGVVLLDASTGEQLEALPLFHLVAFGADGKTLVNYTSIEDEVLLWNMPPRPSFWIRALLPIFAFALTLIWWSPGRRDARERKGIMRLLDRLRGRTAPEKGSGTWRAEPRKGPADSPQR